MLVLAALLGPIIGAALTQGRTRVLFLWVAAGLFGCFLLGGLLLAVLGMLATRRGREELAAGCAEGCLEALQAATLVVPGPEVALDLLLHPRRLAATLRP